MYFQMMLGRDHVFRQISFPERFKSKINHHVAFCVAIGLVLYVVETLAVGSRAWKRWRLEMFEK